jgi:AP-3 complex subunit beta
MTPSLGGFLTPMMPSVSMTSNRVELVGPSFVAAEKLELLNKVNGYGMSVTYKYTRSPHLFSANMVSMELCFTNHGNIDLTDIHIGAKQLASGMFLNEFAPISQLAPKQSVLGVLGIDFNDSSQSANFEIRSNAGNSKVSIKPSIGELLRSIIISENMFKEERNKLRGMSESSCKILIRSELQEKSQLQKKIFEIANVAKIAAISQEDPENLLLFAGQTLTSKSLVLISIFLQDKNTTALLNVNCEKLVVGSILMTEVKDQIKM